MFDLENHIDVVVGLFPSRIDHDDAPARPSPRARLRLTRPDGLGLDSTRTVGRLFSGGYQPLFARRRPMGRAVFEAANESLKEMFVGATPSSLSALKMAHRTTPPSVIAHWRQDLHQINYREIERDLSEADIQLFVEEYARSLRRAGWRVITERLAPRP